MADRDSMKTYEKLQWHLLPFDVLKEVVEVLMGEYLVDGTPTGGKAKYGANNWRTSPFFTPETVYDSLQRHTVARFFEHEERDKNSGKRHTAHIIANAIFAHYYDTYNLWDNESSEIPSPPTPPSQIASDLVDVPTESSSSLPLALRTASPQDLAKIRQAVVERWKPKAETPLEEIN